MSKDNLQTELYDARLIGFRQRAEIRGAEIGDQSAEIRVIEEIENLAAKLQFNILRYFCAFHKGDVQILDGRKLNQIAWHTANQTESRFERIAFNPAAALINTI